ncbi:MAG: ABC transporter substrate-binding protein [Betaproteobacteria bacterium]|nr:ABC transporter substrate-binding protein [Betaproteobacteria bacterium]
MRGFVFFLSFWITAAGAAQQPEPEALVRRITAEVLQELRADKALQAGDRQKAIRLAEAKILPHVDFMEATRFVMGRAWSRASPAQRERLAAEFRRLLIRTYANAFHGYRGQAMEVLPVRMHPQDTEVTVRNRYVRPGGPPLMVDYAMHKTPEGWKIFDVAVEGISLLMVYRAEFAEQLRRVAIDELIQGLSEKNEARAELR